MKKLAREGKLNKSNLMDSLKNLNEHQLEKLSKYLKVKIDRNETG